MTRARPRVRNAPRRRGGAPAGARDVRRHRERAGRRALRLAAGAVSARARMVTDGRFPLGTAAVLATPQMSRTIPNVVKVVAADDGRAMYFSRAPIPFLRDRRRTPSCSARGSGSTSDIYAYDRSGAAAMGRVAGEPARAHRAARATSTAGRWNAASASPLIDEPVRPGIDTEADLERANRDWSAFTTG